MPWLAMVDGAPRDGDYRTARMVLALIFGTVAALIALAPAFRMGDAPDPLVFGGLIAAALGLLAVDLPVSRK